MIKFFKAFFNTDFENSNIQFKVKVDKEFQDFINIAEYSAYGYWRIEGSIFWRNLGLLHRETRKGIWRDSYYPLMLNICEEKFKKYYLENAYSNIRTVSTKEITKDFTL